MQLEGTLALSDLRTHSILVRAADETGYYRFSIRLLLPAEKHPAAEGELWLSDEAFDLDSYRVQGSDLYT